MAIPYYRRTDVHVSRLGLGSLASTMRAYYIAQAIMIEHEQLTAALQAARKQYNKASIELATYRANFTAWERTFGPTSYAADPIFTDLVGAALDQLHAAQTRLAMWNNRYSRTAVFNA